MSKKTVKEIVAKYLKENGYDGLCTSECGCFLGDLAPCVYSFDECVPGYRKMTPDGPIITEKSETNERKTTVIDWHPWPEENPPEDGDFLVTVHNKRSGEKLIDDCCFIDGIWKGWDIIAWAYPIEPYRREK